MSADANPGVEVATIKPEKALARCYPVCRTSTTG
jgi:hypothetical protein